MACFLPGRAKDLSTPLYYLRNNPEEGSSHLSRDGNLKSRMEAVLYDVIPLYFEVILRESRGLVWCSG